jgi:pimeloyl-ACP methyl ester carboxylesterase
MGRRHTLDAVKPALVLILALALVTPASARPPRKRVDAVPQSYPVTGTLVRALDPSGAVPGTIGIAYEFYPQSDMSRPNEGSIVAVEGGPGYPSTGTRASYLALFKPLLGTRNLLLVDNRGTGRSAAVQCPALQRDPFYMPANVAACGARLGASAALYGSGLAADDLAAVLDALNIGKIDLYGDSYGTFFAQAFAGRHPERLRSVVLDAAYAVIGADPWYPEAAPQAATAFNAACARTPACAALPGTSMDRIGALLQQLREHPVTGTAPDGDGNPQTATADARGLAYAMLSNASGMVVYRELDAAARAWSAGDTAPLLRLVAENQTAAVSSNGSTRARSFSAGLFTAVSCADYTQIYRMTDPPAQRAQQAAAAIAAKQVDQPEVYAPFSIEEFLSMPQDYSVLNLCQPWPVPAPAWPPGQPVPPGAVFTSAPVLVLSGELDSLTPPAQGAQAAALFPQAKQVLVRNSFHVTALGDLDHCASELVRHFVSTLSPGDTACAEAVPAYRALPQFARLSSELTPASPAPGNQGTTADLRAAAAALFAASDALARWWVNYDGDGVGLRGGTFAYTTLAGSTRFTLTGLRWTDDVPVSGRLTWLANTVQASLTLPGGQIEARWPDRVPGAVASITGTLNGHRIAATMTAP